MSKNLRGDVVAWQSCCCCNQHHQAGTGTCAAVLHGWLGSACKASSKLTWVDRMLDEGEGKMVFACVFIALQGLVL
jgi:hypothetical protein